MTIKHFCMIKGSLHKGIPIKSFLPLEKETLCNHNVTMNLYSSNVDHAMYIYTITIYKIMNSVIQRHINTASTDNDLEALREEEIIQANNT